MSKKIQIESNLQKIFEQFSQKNKLVFSKLINTVKNEQNRIVGSLDFLKRNVKQYLGEEALLSQKNSDIFTNPRIDANYRKQ